MTHQTRWKSGGLRLLAVLAAVMLVFSGAAVAQEAPKAPHEVYGTVTDQNGDAVDGVTVEAVYDGEVLESTTTDSSGYYELKVPDPSDDASGEEVTIRTNDGQTSEEDSATITWESAVADSRDLSVVVEDDSDTGGGDDPATDPDDGDDGGSTGGGGQAGGGGGADEPTTTSTPPTTGASGTAQIDANGSATVDLTEGEGVESVSVSSPGASGDVTVTELSAPPEGVSEPSGTSVAMVDISAPNPSEGSATVQISVRQSALPDGVSASDLGITHYTDGAWQDLDTSVASSDGPIVLEAQVSSFSPFAVTAQDQATATSTQTATDTVTETTGPTDTETTAPTDDGEGGGGFPVVPVVVAVVLVAALGGGWLYTQRE